MMTSVHTLWIIGAVTVVCSGLSIRTGSGNLSLLDSLQQLAQNVEHLSGVDGTDNPAGGTMQTITKAPIPGGRLNVCEDLCPKWCQKVAGSDNFTNCHYMCGNICDKQEAYKNPYIGNDTYEVVPIEYSFNKYDTDKDKQITLEEFAAVERVTLGEALDLFTFADGNYDGFIDMKEFKGGPLVFTVQMAAELNSMVRQTKSPVQNL